MEIRLTRRPGQAGTKKFVERYGERLYAMSPLANACVEVEVTHHVHYDPEGARLHG